jgi:indolepyruvate ferredoxin oxidoreductase, beta subunit
MSYDIVLAGVGGQGILLASRILMEEAMLRGSTVRGSETHGMAQRGGSVVAHVRLGRCNSPLVLPKTAQMVVGLNALEGIRALPFFGDQACFLANAPHEGFVSDEVRHYLDEHQVTLKTIDASKMALERNQPRTVNITMLGFAAAQAGVPFSVEGFRQIVSKTVKPRFRNANLEALQLGYQQGQ